MTDIQRLHSNDRTSQAVIYQQHIETAGLVAKIPHGTGIAEQTQCVLTQLEQLLHDAGSNKYRILRIQIWLANMADFAAMNQVYDAWVKEMDKPARACVGAQLASPDYLIEIQAKAAFD